jgi:pimeloyl-ACP methyl ester carboxylesterase
MSLLTTAHQRIGYSQSQAAPASADTILFLHSSGASRAQWKAYLAAFGASHACLAPDLVGYGETVDLAGRPFKAAHEHEVVAALLATCRGAVHLVGHSYGGAVALNFALAEPSRIASLTLIEPVAFNLLREARDPAWAEIETLAGRHIAQAEAGDLSAAADAFMGYWIGAHGWQGLPEAQRLVVTGTMGKVADEWRSMFAPTADLPRLRKLGVPTLLMRGTATRAPAHRVVQILHEAMPAAHLTEIEGAGHMAPLTHAPAIIEALQMRLQRLTAAAAA